MRIHVPIVIVSIVIVSMALSGCPGAIVDTLNDIGTHADLSTGSSVSVIQGSKWGGADREYCHIDEPARTFELVTDSGSVSIIAACFGYDPYRRTAPVFAAIEFDAQAGHRYRIERNRAYRRHVELIDYSDNRRLVARRPSFRLREDAVSSTSMAVAFHQYEHNGFRCRPIPNGGTIEKWGKPFAPGEASFTVLCLRYNNPFGTRPGNIVEQAYTANISFIATPGGVYRIDVEEKNPACIKVSEVSRDTRLIVCEPPEQRDDLIGRKFSLHNL